MGTAGSFSRVYIAETGAGLDGSGREKPALQYGNRVAPKKYRSILFRSARGRWGSNPAGIPIRGGSIHDIERSPSLKIVGHDFERTILSEDLRSISRTILRSKSAILVEVSL